MATLAASTLAGVEAVSALPADRRTAGIVFLGLLLVMVVLAFWASRWRRPTNIHDMEEWGVAGRAFGNWVTWFLIGGAAFTAYTFVSIPAYGWGYGAMAMFPVPYALICTPLIFLVATRAWSVSHAHGFLTSAEFSRARFGSRPLSLLVALTSIAATLPYMAVQLVALSAVFQVLGVQGEWPLLASLAILSVTTFRGGLRAPALLSIVKDVLLIWLVLAAVLVVAMSGGWSHVFEQANLRFSHDNNPASGILLNGSGQEITYLTLIVGSALSIFAYPHTMTAILAAKDRNTIKRNAAAMPIYCLVLGLMALLGIFAAARGVFPVDATDPAHGKIGNINTIAPMIFNDTFPAWSAGIAYATIAAAALIPTALMSIGVSNTFTRAVYMEYFRPRASMAEEARVTRWTSLLVKFAAAGVVLALDSSYSLDMQTIGSVLILQVLPAVFFGLFTGWFHRWALIAGLLAGLASSFYLLYKTSAVNPDGSVKAHFAGSNWDLANWGYHTHQQVYIGLITLLLNLVIVVVLTAVFKLFHVSPNLDHTRAEDYEVDADAGVDRLDDLLDGLPQQREGAHALR